ncbi:tyrosine-type recombinase/integrase [Caminibacter pacificus]
MQGKKIKITNTEGIFYLDEGKETIEVNGEGYLTTQKFKKDFKLLIVVTKRIKGKKRFKRKILKFDRRTSLRAAIKVAIAERVEILKKLTDDPAERRKLDKNIEEPMTLDEAFESYLPKRNVKERTKRDYQSFYNVHLRHSLGHKYLDEIDAYDIQKVIDSLTAKGYAKRTVFKVIDVLNPLFKHYKILRRVKDNPLEYLQKDRKFDNEVEIHLSDEQKRALLHSIKEYPIEPFRSIFVFLSTGRRLSEVLKLEWKHINEEEGYYMIPKENSKSSKELIFPLTDDLIDALRQQDRRGKYVFHAITDPDKPIHPGSLKRHWRRILDMTRIEKFRIHDLRHLIGNTLVSHGATLEEIATILGHSSINVTRRYAKAELNSKRKTMEKFKKLLDN